MDSMLLEGEVKASRFSSRVADEWNARQAARTLCKEALAKARNPSAKERLWALAKDKPASPEAQKVARIVLGRRRESVCYDRTRFKRELSLALASWTKYRALKRRVRESHSNVGKILDQPRAGPLLFQAQRVKSIDWYSIAKPTS